MLDLPTAMGRMVPPACVITQLTCPRGRGLHAREGAAGFSELMGRPGINAVSSHTPRPVLRVRSNLLPQHLLSRQPSVRLCSARQPGRLRCLATHLAAVTDRRGAFPLSANPDRPSTPDRAVPAPRAFAWRQLGRLWRSPAGQPRWARPCLLAVAALAAVFYAWNIGDSQYNGYFSTAVRSMTESPTAF